MAQAPIFSGLTVLLASGTWHVTVLTHATAQGGAHVAEGSAHALDDAIRAACARADAATQQVLAWGHAAAERFGRAVPAFNASEPFWTLIVQLHRATDESGWSCRLESAESNLTVAGAEPELVLETLLHQMMDAGMASGVAALVRLFAVAAEAPWRN